MRVLVIGLGSIAKKHIAAMNQIDNSLEVIALRSGRKSPEIPGIKSIYDLGELNTKIDFCIVSNPTANHYTTLEKLLPLNIPLFIEKPSLMSLDNAEILLKKINDLQIKTYVGFCLRFHPVIGFLKEFVQNRRIIEVNIYCGSYLPFWRQGVDYREVYSAKKEMGGGVQYDLSHEIDYALWLFGIPEKIERTKLQISDLEINSCDFAGYRLIYIDKVVNITLNYYRKNTRRSIEVVFDNDIVHADLIKYTIESETVGIIYNPNLQDYNLYIKQMKHFYNVVNGTENSINSFEDSLVVVDIL